RLLRLLLDVVHGAQRDASGAEAGIDLDRLRVHRLGALEVATGHVDRPEDAPGLRALGHEPAGDLRGFHGPVEVSEPQMGARYLQVIVAELVHRLGDGVEFAQGLARAATGQVRAADAGAHPTA